MTDTVSKIKIAIIGTQGLPAEYGGFETLAHYLVEYLSTEFDITVFCSSKIYPNKLKVYNGCRLEYIPFHANGIQSILFDILSILKARKNFDKILLLGASGGFIMPFLKGYRKKFILNFGGLDWQRSKWSFFAQRIIRLFERFAVNNSAFLIADNDGIQEYIKLAYQRKSYLIAYGGDQVFQVKPEKTDQEKYPFLNSLYAFSVARIQPDNNIDMILDSFINSPPFPIVFVGNWSSSEYGIKTKAKYSKCNKILLLDAIYEQRELNLLRSNCSAYLHGHSAGGTNPSLVEAMHLSLPIIAFASGFNEYTTKNKAMYFSSSEELAKKINDLNFEHLRYIGKEMKNIASSSYRWELIARKYSEVFRQN